MCLWPLQSTITPFDGVLLIFFLSGAKKLLDWLEIEPATLDHVSQSGAYYLLAMVNST